MIKINEEIYERYLKDIKNLIYHFVIEEYRKAEILDNLKKFIIDGSAFVSGHILDDKLVSFIWCHPRKFSGQDRLHISYFIVDEEYRGKGLSKDLIKFAKETAEELNLNIIDLNVEQNNEKAIRVYKNAGFDVEKIQLIMHLSEE